MRTQRSGTNSIGFGPLGRAALAAAAFAALAGPASALPIGLEDGVATVTIDDATGAVSAWTVDGASHVREQALYFRLGASGGESTFGALVPGASSASDGDGDGDLDTLVLGFTDPGGAFSVEASWRLAGSPPGGPASGASSTLEVDLEIVNLGSGSLDLWLFQYSDADVFGSFADDSASFSGANGGSATDGSGLASWRASWAQSPDGFEASLYGALLASLGDGAPTALSGAGAAGPGDVTSGVAFHLLLGGAERQLLAQVQEIDVAAVPEPGVALLVSMGLAALAAGRRISLGGKRS